MNTSGNDCSVKARKGCSGFVVAAGDNFGDSLQGMFFVSWVDALGRIAEEKVGTAFQAGRLFKNGSAEFLGQSGIDC